ncbi:hypothetical protein [Bradyrhizobium sp.]|uniref:hypothetical protein n=1 Tax=Bradyrhizobium sp. TaxID=376 RepID=UPI001EB522CA|nr:hypothetical protein [Bradyrhizobium sp.]MBV9981794.1 hypothetical protein [Bradyrhizobium sp.]
MRRAAGPLALAVAIGLAACSPGLPKGVDKDRLDEAVSDAIGDPNTCLLIGKAGSGQVVYRYNTHTTCDRALPACDQPGLRTVDDLLKAVARDGRPRTLSCSSSADGSRGVGWSAAPIAGRGVVYAAVMEGERALPGRIMADKVDGALKDAGF